MAVEIRQSGTIVTVKAAQIEKIEIKDRQKTTIDVKTGVLGIIPSNYGLITYDGSVITVS